MITSRVSGSGFFPAKTVMMSLIPPLISTITNKIQNAAIITDAILAPVFEESFSSATPQAIANEQPEVMIGIAYDHSLGLSKNQLQRARIIATEII